MRPTKPRIATFVIVYGAGILAQLAMLCAVLWWGITGTLVQLIMAIIIGILLLHHSGGWWFHAAAKITGVETGGHR